VQQLESEIEMTAVIAVTVKPASINERDCLLQPVSKGGGNAQAFLFSGRVAAKNKAAT